MSGATTIGDTRAELWRARLGSALRTTLACTIVSCTVLHGPAWLRQYLEFPAFSYVTTILLVSGDANLGDTIRGCWHVFCATLQVMILSIVGLRVVGPAHFTSPVAATAVAVSAFVVAVPEATHLLTKRIAFGQLVIVYVKTVIRGAEAGVLKHPIHVASCTALGALASVLAMLIPYPRLAHFQVKKAFGLYAENASERFSHNLEAISASDNSTARGLCIQSKSLAKVGAKLLQWVKSNLDGMRWERPRTRAFYEKLQDKEIPLRGMDIALSGCTSFPVGFIDEELRGVLLDYRGRLSLKLDKQASCFASFNASTAPARKNKEENLKSFPWSLKNLSITYKHLPTSFFLYCVQLLLEDTPIATNTNKTAEKAQKTDADERGILKRIKEVIINMLPSSQNLAFAFKCSVSLGLAVFFGLLYDRENALWSGLTVAISFVTKRQPTFSVANARGQGTAMGSTYGVICSFLLHKFGAFSFLSLLPWVVFCSFLMHSKMYGQAGGMSAVIGALLILGRRNYSTPAQFAIARIAEATIGLTCFIVVEIMFNPSRGRSLAKSELSNSFRALQDCIDTIIVDSSDKQKPCWKTSQELRERQENLKSIVVQLEEFIEEAGLEPNFWFLPFHGACYRKILDSLSTMTDLLLFVAHLIDNVSKLSTKGVMPAQLQDRVNETIEIFKAKVIPTLKCLEEITRIKSLRKLERKGKKRNRNSDIELAEHPNADSVRVLRGNEEVESITCSFLQHLEEMADAVRSNSDEEAVRGQIIVQYSCLAFCFSGLTRETIRVENKVKELVMWENPSSDSSFSEIYCKINALRS
ncbi:uncharacterized protein LOC129306396 [Prosopis cineraria]|uniref:uncharacterized protein LOC129306396 n=1 Tax=Prosopis cineraria TaxID=364024 RepID=UPI00240EDE64|nr:uncharacterized protein LOC129306396 [Prosopis cineraria]